MRVSPGLALVLLFSSVAVPARAEEISFNVILHKNIDVYSGVTDVWGYTSPDSTVELAIYGHDSGTSFVDATDPANAVEVFNLPGPTTSARDIKTYLEYAYIVADGGSADGLQIVDLSDPLNPVHVTTYSDSNFTAAHNLAIDVGAGVAYACGALGGMHILSLADPENPVELDLFNAYYIHDLHVANGIALVAQGLTGALGILDASNPANLTAIASFASGARHNVWPFLGSAYCATTDELANGRVRILRLTNPTIIVEASSYRVEGAIVHNVFVEDEIAYISYYTAGTRMVDVSDPWNPIEVGYYDTFVGGGETFNGNWGVYPFRSDDVVYSSDRQSGLFILEFTGGHAGTITGTATDAQTTAGIGGAMIEVETALSLIANVNGYYSDRTVAGTYSVVTTAFGYVSDTTSVVIPEGSFVVHDVALQPLPLGDVELELLELGSGAPVDDARAAVLNTVLPSQLSGIDGKVALPSLPAGLTLTVRVGKFGRKLTDVPVTAVAGSSMTVQVDLPPGFSDDFDFDQRWIFGGGDDDATGGVWERGIPVGSYWSGIVSPEEDASPTGDGWALLTEANDTIGWVGATDVDDGKTTVLTPLFDASGLGSLTLTYERWFSNRAPSQSPDEFRADVSTDGGSSWTNLETVAVGTDSWASVNVDVSALVTPSNQMQLRFVAEDRFGDTYVEAGIDDLQILTTATESPAVERRAPGALSLVARPNPFHEITTIEFDVPSPGPVSLSVFDVAGRKIAELVRAPRLAAGRHRASWGGRDGSGKPVAAGVYFVKLTAPEGEERRKIHVLR